jgi:putative CocE/NonD family hydrolase
MSSQASPPRKPRFLDNLVALKPAQFGAQYAGWKPDAAVASGLGCQVLADQEIPVADGISLAADVYLPKKEGRYPAVLAFGAYTKELHAAGVPAGTNEIGNPPTFADRGYVHVVVERRGMGRSGGETKVFFNAGDVDDHERAIAWCAEQPWCDGRVVMFGTSYYGCVQPQVAVRRPPALKAFFANEMCTDFYRHIAMFGGTPAIDFLNIWMGANFTDTIMKLRVPPLVRAIVSRILNSRLKAFWWPRFQRRMPAIMRIFAAKKPTRAVREMWASWMLDGKTRDTHTIPAGPYAELANIDVPFVVVQNLGMFNLHQFGSYDLFRHASSARKWMILGEPEYKLPVYEWQGEALAFFDHVLHGADNGYAAQPRVRYWLEGANAYRGADDFPLPSRRALRLHPASTGADAGLHRLSPTPPPAATNRWAAIPRGTPTIGGLDEVINQRLVYDYVVDRSIELAGPVTANLVFSSNEIDSYAIARVGRVDRAGGYHLLSLGAISPARRAVDTSRSNPVEIAIDIDRREPLVPGEPVVLRFSLTPGPTRLEPGDALRFEIASRSDLLESDSAHDHAHFQLQVPPYFSRNTLHCGADTWIELDEVAA